MGPGQVHDAEWTAVQAAHRRSATGWRRDRQALDQQLRRQYRSLENRRRDFASAWERLDAGLPGRGSRKVFEAFRQAVATGSRRRPTVPSRWWPRRPRAGRR